MNQPQQVPEHTPLSGEQSWVVRNGFSHWAMAMIWIVVAFILFQITAGIVAVVLLLITEPGGDFLELLTERVDILFIGNSTGQILFLGLATWLVAGLHTQKQEKRSFLRLKANSNTVRMTLLAAVLFVVVQPIVLLIGYLNSLVPVPESFTELQQSQYEMIENFLTGDGMVLMALINIALVPAVCEEVMFRGYVQRAFEKSWGIWPAIVISGLVFGLFHLQATHLLPLATLGILLALVTWLSGSLIPAIVAHFINNGAAVLAGSHYPELVFTEMSAETLPPIWVLLASGILTAFVLVQLFKHASEEQ